MTLQAEEKVSADALSIKEAHIAALTTELSGKDEMLRANNKVCVLLNSKSMYIIIIQEMKCACGMRYGVIIPLGFDRPQIPVQRQGAFVLFITPHK